MSSQVCIYQELAQIQYIDVFLLGGQKPSSVCDSMVLEFGLGLNLPQKLV